jgi:purine-nucleoside phosphorylase
MSAAKILRDAVGRAPFDAVIILGTGLGGLADAVVQPTVIPYADLPGFPQAGVSGHSGRLVIGQLEGRRVAVMQGRAHVYEHGNSRAMAAAIETFAAHGTSALIITNAAGSLKPSIVPGSIVAISDHISLFGPNPLIGVGGDERFVGMNDAYDPGLRAALSRSAAGLGLTLPEGVYAWVTGPSFETPAEIRALAALGADLVGMSTVPEVILARYAGLRVAALSMVTNMAAGLAAHAPSHQETKTVALEGGERMQALICGLLREMN